MVEEAEGVKNILGGVSPNEHFNRVVTAQMPNGKRVRIVVDCNQQLSDVEINAIVNKVQALGRIYVIGEDTKSFELTEKIDEAMLKREKIVGDHTKTKTIIKRNFLELLSAGETKSKTKHQGILNKPEDQLTGEDRLLLTKMNQKTNRANEARRLYREAPQRSAQPVVNALPQDHPAQAIHGNDFVMQVQPKDPIRNIPAQGRGELRREHFEFTFCISSTKDLKREQLMDQLNAIKPAMAIYARFLEKFPMAVVAEPKRGITDFKKYVRGEVQKKEREIRREIGSPNMTFENGEQYDHLQTLLQELKTLPYQKSILPFWKNQFSLKIEFRKAMKQ